MNSGKSCGETACGCVMFVCFFVFLVYVALALLG